MFISILLISLFSVVTSTILPPTVNQLNVNSYLGHWVQMYGAPTNVIFQGYGKCLTAQYNSLENGYVSVINSQINSNNDLEQITGYAYYTNYLKWVK